MSALTIALLIILSPLILFCGLFSLFIICALIYSIISIPIEAVKKIKEEKKQGDD